MYIKAYGKEGKKEIQTAQTEKKLRSSQHNGSKDIDHQLMMG